jgi:hypothetical protein
VVIAGFEPLDVLQAVGMLIEQINQGRTEVETQFSRAVTHEGNQKARERVAQTMVLRDSFEWRGLGQVPHSALAIHPDFADFDAELLCPALPSCAGPQGLRVRRHPAWPEAAAGLQGIRHCLHRITRWAPAWCPAKGLCRPLPLWPFRTGSHGMSKPYARPLDLKHGLVNLTHGSGGRAMAQLVSELFAAEFANDWLAQGNDQAILPPPGGRIAIATDSHVISPLFFPVATLAAWRCMAR